MLPNDTVKVLKHMPVTDQVLESSQKGRRAVSGYKNRSRRNIFAVFVVRGCTDMVQEVR